MFNIKREIKYMETCYGQCCPSADMQRDAGIGTGLTSLMAILLICFTMLVAPPVYAYQDPLDTPAMKTELAKYSLLLDVTKVGDRLIAVGERGHILYSEDNGVSWTQADVPAMVQLTAVTFSGAKKGWAVGDDAAILHTEDGGVTWVRQYDQRDSDFPVPLLDVLFFNELEGFAIGSYGKILRTVDGGKTWVDWMDHIDNIDEWHLNAITMTDKGELFIAGEAGFVYRSINSGQTWQTLKTPHEGSFLGLVSLPSPDRIFVFGISGYVYMTKDGGETWTEVELDTKAGLAGGVALSSGQALIVGGDGIILKEDPSTNTFIIHRREDRIPMSSVIESNTGDYIMLGFGGPFVTKPADIEKIKEAGGEK